MIDYRDNYDKVVSDLLRPVHISRAFIIWMAVLIAALGVSIYYFIQQYKVGLGITGMRDVTSWGMYIANFVFFVATSLIGMLITSVLGLLGVKWAKPLARIAEIIALAFAMVAGIVIIVDMGRPERLIYVFLYGRVQSPIAWDVTVILTYTVISLLLLYIPLIPDMKICSESQEKLPSLQKKIYRILSLNWNNNPEQLHIIHRSIRILAILIIPTALAIHTVTSWLFAVTLRPGWDSTIFGPYFVTGAFVSGCAAVIIAMFFFRENYKLKDYITDLHFDKMAKLTVLVMLVYLYFNINEFLVPGYKLKKMDALHLHALFAGRYALLFWATQLGGLIIPIILMLFRAMRKATPMLIISIFIIAGAWLKRYIIVVPTQEHPFLPVQNVPHEFMVYTPTFPEIAITGGTIVLALIIITILAKFLPIIPVWEMTQEKGEKSNG